MKNILWILAIFSSTMLLAQTPEEKLQAAGYTLSKVSPPVANYVNVVVRQSHHSRDGELENEHEPMSL